MKVAIYARVSRDDKDKDGKQVQHLENQLLALREFCLMRDWTIVHEYTDMVSGKSGEREQLKAMLTAASRHRFNALLVWSLDRLTREGIGPTFDYIRRLQDYGVDFISYKEEHFRTTGATGKLMLAIAAWIAEQERQRLSERTKAGLERVRRAGTVLGRPRSVDIVKDGALIRSRRAGGDSISSIANELGVSGMTIRRYLGGSRSVSD